MKAAVSKPKKNGKNGRNANGKFANGNNGGPGRGNGKDKICREALAIIRDEFNEDDLRKVIRRLITGAKGGNVKAAALLLAYKAGKPTESIEISGAEGGAVQWVTKLEIIDPVNGKNNKAESQPS